MSVVVIGLDIKMIVHRRTGRALGGPVTHNVAMFNDFHFIYTKIFQTIQSLEKIYSLLENKIMFSLNKDANCCGLGSIFSTLHSWSYADCCQK